MSQAEMLILGGALLLVLVDLVFALAINAYSFPEIIWLAAVLALVVAYVQRERPRLLPAPYASLLLALAAIVVLVGLREVVDDVLFILRPPAGANPAYLLGLVGLVAGVGAMAAGAWQMWRGPGR